jgi:predicted nucleotidyltransferase
MNKRSDELRNLANKIVRDLNISNTRFATVGGSVGRGDADNFSDLDLNIYISNGYVKNSMFVYEGEVVQLFVSDQVPTERQVKDNPWEFRFILETVPVYDPRGEFHVLKDWVKTYFSSINGRAKLAKEATDVVNIRKKWAINSLRQGNNYSAKLAASSAWADAAFMYLFFAQDSLSTGSLISQMKNINKNYNEYIRILPFSLDLVKDGTGELLRIVERHREFLRQRYPLQSQCFSLSPLQDILVRNKAQRLYNAQEYENMLWQLSGEVFFLFLEFSEGKSFEEYFNALPRKLRNDLVSIGFTTLDDEKVLEICKLSDQLVDLSAQFIVKNTGDPNNLLS